jgi:hypothetical protein
VLDWQRHVLWMPAVCVLTTYTCVLLGLDAAGGLVLLQLLLLRRLAVV